MQHPSSAEDALSRAWQMCRGGAGLWFADAPPPGRLPGRIAAVVQTSGSTAGPKRVTLGREAVRHAARASVSFLGRPPVWHLALPVHYVAGLMVVARAHAAGGPLPRLAGAHLEHLAPTGEGDAISLVPTQLHRALRDPAVVERLAGFDAILVGGAPLSPALRAAAAAAGLRVTHTYGMSETCGGCVFDGQPLDGVVVDLLPDDRAPVGGRVALSGPMLFDGYWDDPAATSDAVRDGRLLTSDRGRWVAGRLHIDGRIDDVVITGGVNVDLATVRAAVARHDDQAAVLAVDDEEWGSRIVLFSRLSDLEGWRSLLSADLPREALPRQVVTVPDLPLTAGGKPDRAALLRMAQQ